MPPSVCRWRYLLLNLWVEFYQTCYITSPHGKGVQEQHYFSVCPSSIHLSVRLSPPKPLGEIQPNFLHHFPSWLWCARATLIFIHRHLCRPSICLSRYPPKPLGRIQPNSSLPLMLRVCQSNIFFLSVHPSSIHLSIMLSPPKPLGRIQPNLLHHFPSW